MIAYYTDRYVLPLPPGHRFPMEKYARLRRRVERELPLARLTEPAAASDAELGRAHDPAYVRRASDGSLSAEEIRAIGFPWSPQMVERSRRSAGATLAACRAALREHVAVNLAGGTHHAHRNRGAGFCVFNDAAVAARGVQAEGLAERVAVIDCDVHQGDGTAAIAAGDATLFTLSLHGAKNFPFRKASSDLDVELPDGTGDADYLDALADALAALFRRFEPELAIYLAGADPYAGDRLGRLALSKAGLARRDRLVLDTCLSRGVPVALAMAGGYAEDIDDTVDIHFGTVSEACRAWARHAPGCLAVSLATQP
ncbi:MAG TPA: histone deacetylase [Rhodocyclaceae bacterium]|nr:histone deacetylase [Rhodocyclaceae bacterium]